MLQSAAASLHGWHSLCLPCLLAFPQKGLWWDWTCLSYKFFFFPRMSSLASSIALWEKCRLPSWCLFHHISITLTRHLWRCDTRLDAITGVAVEVREVTVYGRWRSNKATSWRALEQVTILHLWNSADDCVCTWQLHAWKDVSKRPVSRHFTDITAGKSMVWLIELMMADFHLAVPVYCARWLTVTPSWLTGTL